MISTCRFMRMRSRLNRALLASAVLPGLLVAALPGDVSGQTAPGGAVLPAAIRPIMPPGAPPVPSAAAGTAGAVPGKTDKALTEAGLPKALHDRLQAFQVTAILDGMAVMRVGAGSMAVSAGEPGTTGGGVVLTVRHGKPFVWVGEHLLWPVVEARTVALYWSEDAQAGPAQAVTVPEGARLAFYGEIGAMPMGQAASRNADAPGAVVRVIKTRLDAREGHPAQERAD